MGSKKASLPAKIPEIIGIIYEREHRMGVKLGSNPESK